MKLGTRHDEEPPDYPLLPEEVYVAEFIEYGEPKPSDFLDRRTGEYPMQIRLVFAVKDHDADDRWQGERAGAWYNLDLNALQPKSIYHPLLALDPDNEPQGGEDLDEFVGKRCRVSVKHIRKGEKTYANIDRVMPLKKKRGGGTADGDADRREPVAAGRGKTSAFNVDDDE